MVRVGMLGAIELHAADGREVAAADVPASAAALLAYLAAARPRGFHTRHHLADLLYADAPAEAPRRLGDDLEFLARHLGREALESDGDAVALRADRLELDLPAFEAAATGNDIDTVRRLYRGDFGRGIVARGPAFAAWLEQERSRYRGQAIAAALRTVDRYERDGEHQAALGCARWAVDVAPADQSAFRALIRLTDAHVGRSEARRLCDGFEAHLTGGTGLESGTIALVARVRAQSEPQPARAEGRAGGPVVPAWGSAELLQRTRDALADRYEVVREIGAGGMGVVYLANDLRLGRQVAVKVLRPEIAAGLGPERFQREIEVTARLRHPNILPLFDSGSVGDLHYFVTPFIDGESLQQRLRRTPQLRLDETLRIARGIAAGLDAAHAQSILHRDIKPGNVLLSGDQVIVADFGLARVIDGIDPDTLTATGTVVGTPEYMSPEQASGGLVDRGTDIYALGCVVYEMLAGEPPFAGASRQAVVLKQISEAPPSLRVVRPAMPVTVDRAIRSALRKNAADRPPSAGAFVAALERRSPWSPATIAAAAAGAAAAVWLLVRGAITVLTPGTVVTDTTQYAVLPFTHAAGIVSELDEVRLISDALRRWDGVTVADPFRVQGALAGRDTAALDLAAAARLVAGLGVGRFIRGTVSPLGDSLRVEAALYDAERGARLAAATARLPGTLAGADAIAAGLVDQLLFRGAAPADPPTAATTRSLPARQTWERGRRALATWDLAVADTAFAASGRWDPEYVHAHLWLALVRWWSGGERARWQISAEQVARNLERFQEPDRAMAEAVVAELRGDPERACAVWRGLTEHIPREYTGWLGLARCLAGDEVVLRDPASPSGWRFRTSYQQALTAYRRAFVLHPTILASYRDESYGPLRELFLTGGNQLRRGRGVPPDTTRFAADPFWQGDSLAFVPYPVTTTQAAGRTAPADEQNEAVRRQREALRDVTLSWAAAAPASGDAMEALAIAMALLGDPAALDTLRRARTLAREPAARSRVAVSQVWMQLAFALPWDLAGTRRARALADSLLRERPPDRAGEDAWFLAGLATLTGRGNAAAAYVRAPSAAGALGAPLSLRGLAPTLLVLAALGGPPDTLAMLEERVTAIVDETLLPPERPAARLQWLARAATLAFPVHPFAGLDGLAGGGDWLLDAQTAWTVGDTLAVRRALAEARAARAGFLPANLTIDALYPEAALLVALGDARGAAEWLDPTLRALPQVAPHILASPVHAASLLRVAALRARIAEALGDRDGARRWAAAVAALWSDADAFLQPLVMEMGRLAR